MNTENGNHYKYHVIEQRHVGQPLDPALIVEIRGGSMKPMLFTALKKILEPGERGNKTYDQDVKDAIGALERELEVINLNTIVETGDAKKERLPDCTHITTNNRTDSTSGN